MAQYTHITRPEIETILRDFAIQNITSFEILSGGSENTNYLIQTEKGKYVLSICEQKTVKRAKELAHLLEHLAKHHFETSKVVHTLNNEPIVLWKDKPLMVKKFIEGKIQKDLSPSLLKLVGTELAKLHKIDAPEYLPKQLDYGKEQFVKVEKYAANSLFDVWLKEKLAYVSPYFTMDLPKAFIHSDVFCDNIIISEEESTVVIMDFEEAAYYYRIFDIGMTIIGVCGEEKTINLDKAKYLLEGYQAELSLLEIELKALKAFTIYAGAAMTFWRHQNFNYTKPDPKLANHYLGLKVLTDYMAEQADDCFIENN